MSQYLKIIKLDTIDSTNRYAWKLAEQGVKEITIISAKTQTHGKGQFDRNWQSPLNQGIYLSFIFRPNCPVNQLEFFPVIFALAIIRSLPKTLNLNIKIPNDVMAGNKKIAGILVESKSDSQTTEFAVVGIGVNINSTKNSIPYNATSVYLETGKIQPLNKLLNQLIKQTLSLYNEFKAKGAKQIIQSDPKTKDLFKNKPNL